MWFSSLIAMTQTATLTQEGDSHKIFNGGDIMHKMKIELKNS